MRVVVSLCVQVVLINGAFPGPPLVGNEGEVLEITVHNQMTHDSMSIHWHGIRMLNNNYNDGTSYVTQCPIGPKETLVYKFLLEKVRTVLPAVLYVCMEAHNEDVSIKSNTACITGTLPGVCLVGASSDKVSFESVTVCCTRREFTDCTREMQERNEQVTGFSSARLGENEVLLTVRMDTVSGLLGI